MSDATMRVDWRLSRRSPNQNGNDEQKRGEEHECDDRQEDVYDSFRNAIYENALR